MRLRFAVIGVGRMGTRHAFNLALGAARGVKLAAVCDIDERALGRVRRFAKGVPAYTDHRQLIEKENLDAVIIATPHYSHEEIAVYAIEHGVNVLCEKPLSVTAESAKRIAAAAQAHPEIKAGVSFNQRSNRMYRHAKKLLSSGVLGEIQRVEFTITDWYRSQAYYDQGGWRASYSGEGGGCLINQCIHQLDILQWLVGMPQSAVSYCYTKDRDITVENDVSAILHHGSFDTLFSASTHELKGTNRLEIACDKGKLVIGSKCMRIYRHKSQREVNKETVRGYGFAPSSVRIKTYGIFMGLSDILLGQQIRSIRAFAKDVAGKGSMLASVGDGLNAVELFNGIYYSAWKGKEVSLPADDRDYAAELSRRAEAEVK